MDDSKRLASQNIEPTVVESFGREWQRFDQSGTSHSELREIFEQYFSVFPWEKLSADAVGFDLGCGTGRWAAFVAPLVSELHCIDPSAALEVARRNLSHLPNCRLHHASVDSMPLADGSADFGYSIGVLHHVPDTAGAIADCARKLKPGAPLLLYLYYAFDNRPFWFRVLWKGSDLVRRIVSRLPWRCRHLIADLIAAFVYWPFARLSALFERARVCVDRVPLSSYRTRSFYVMRNDALDRFGTRLEKRFSRDEIKQMMVDAGLEHIAFRNSAPFWCAVGYQKLS